MHSDLCVVANLGIKILVKSLKQCVRIHNKQHVDEVAAAVAVTRVNRHSKIPVTHTCRSCTDVTFDA
jgi:hypothetical protein